ncbi:MAG: hypothetical protein E7240_04655 [Lachnospiraceae bacterium]|nr:hypothetical protein [Lachnospiraceae bacterium]
MSKLKCYLGIMSFFLFFMQRRSKAAIFILLLAAAVLTACGSRKAADPAVLSITEVMPGNEAAVRGSNGSYDDWIEITNTGSEEISLKNCYLSDDADEPLSFPLPDRELAAGEAVVIYAAGAGTAAKTSGDDLYAPFRLSKKGERILLSLKDGTILSEFSFENASDNVSILPDGTETPYFTPGFENTDAGYIGYLNSLPAPEGLILSEAVNANESMVPHDGEIFSDWVELYNASGSAVELSDYYLSDDSKMIEKSRLPQRVVAPGECVIIYCDDPLEEYEDYVTGFSFGSDDVVLLAKDGKVCDAMCIREIPEGGSIGRSSSGKTGYFLTPTPGAANGEPVLMVTRAAQSSEPEGIYNDITSLNVALSGEGTIYYTTDGSRPTKNSAIYGDPFQIDKTTVIRAMSCMDGKLDSPVRTFSYIINENHTLPVLSLSVNESDLFDEETGIYVEGNNNNYYQDWEKHANLTLFNENGTVFNADCGLKMSGAESRRIMVKKSMRVNFKAKYGTSVVKADIFGNGVTRFKSLVLRGGEDMESAIFRTEAFATISKDLDIYVQSDQFCILYVNGRYWGIFSLLERFSPDYVAEHAGVPDYNARVEHGKIEEDQEADSYVMEVLNWMLEHDLSDPDNYRWVEERVDLMSLIDWTIMEAYSRNGDISYNVRYCYSTDGKLKITWALFDLDWAFHTAGDSFYAVALDRQYAWFMQRLMENESFRQMFVDRLAELFKDTLKDENMLSIIDSYHDLLEPEVRRDRERWDYTNQSDYDMWERSVEQLRDFVRNGNIREDMIESLDGVMGLTEEQKKQLRDALQ